MSAAAVVSAIVNFVIELLMIFLLIICLDACFWATLLKARSIRHRSFVL
jgi:hypothetical protein